MAVRLAAGTVRIVRATTAGRFCPLSQRPVSAAAHPAGAALRRPCSGDGSVMFVAQD